MAAATLTIGEVSKRSGVATSAIRFYESKGLITSERTAGNQRRYARQVLRRIAVVRAAQAIGVPLARVVEAFAELPADRAPSAAQWEAISAQWRDDLDARIRTLTTLRDGLSGCIACGCLSMDRCPMYNPDDVRAAEGPGARELLT